MSPLGRGLASLIPRRQSGEAAKFIDEIDEEKQTEPETSVPVEPEEEVAPVEPTPEPEAEEQIKIKVTNKVPKVTTAQINTAPHAQESKIEFEELANDEESIPMPTKPNVTPLTFDEETGNLVPVAEGEKHALGENVKYIPLNEIEVNPEQPRRTFASTELDELMQSLQQHGMLQPIVVMEKEDGSGFQIIAGERRWRAAKQLGWAEAPSVVRSGVKGDKNRLELALTENVQRQNLNPIEEAMGYKRLNEEYGMSHEEIGARVGKSRVAITNSMRVLQLPAEIQQGLIDGKITTGHARAILMIPDKDKQVRFYEHVVDEGLTVRKTEVRARNIQRSLNAKNPMASAPPARPQFARQFDAQLQNFYGYNAKVRFNAQKNRFEVRFYAHSEKEIDELVEMLLRRKEIPKNIDADVIED